MLANILAHPGKYLDSEVTPELASYAISWLDTQKNSSMDFIQGMIERKAHNQNFSQAQIRAILNLIRVCEKPKAARIPSSIPDGTYTVVFPVTEDYLTLRLRTNETYYNFKPGVQIVAYMNGPDNSTSFAPCGEMNGSEFIRWKRPAPPKIEFAIQVLLQNPKACAKAYGLRSGKCSLCGHKLTTPESIQAGIGPVCAEKF